MLGHINCDDSWFMTFAEKYLAGEIPYVDISDPNPPAAFLAYVPAIFLAHLTGLTAEITVTLLTFAGALLSIYLCGRILKRAGLLRAGEQAPLLAAASFVLLVVPAFCFAEREHFAVIALLPMLALCAARAESRAVGLLLAVVAGLGAGAALAFKPYYVLAFAAAVLCVALRRRTWRGFFAPEIFATVGVLALYIFSIFWFFPPIWTRFCR